MSALCTRHFFYDIVYELHNTATSVCVLYVSGTSVFEKQKKTLRESNYVFVFNEYAFLLR